jgi:hypothetical protein
MYDALVLEYVYILHALRLLIIANLNEDPDVKDMDTFWDNIDVTVDEVLKKLSCLKNDKSAGPDSLHTKVLFVL